MFPVTIVQFIAITTPPLFFATVLTSKQVYLFINEFGTCKTPMETVFACKPPSYEADRETHSRSSYKCFEIASRLQTLATFLFRQIYLSSAGSPTYYITWHLIFSYSIYIALFFDRVLYKTYTKN